jgi:hypothetical protein
MHRVQLDGGVGVEEVERREQIERLDADAEFFDDFADGGLGGGFAGFAFAAWELPIAAQNIVVGASTDEGSRAVDDDRNGDA